MGYGSIETNKVESTTSRRRGVAVVAALALFGLVVIGGSTHSVPNSGGFSGFTSESGSPDLIHACMGESVK